MFEIKDLESFTLFDPLEDSERKIPDMPGVYAILLRHGSNLPDCEIKHTPCLIDYKGEKYELIYVGISDDGLNKRDYRTHFNGSAGRSTLRKSLGSLMGLKKTYRSEAEKNKNSPKTKFVDEDEEKLSDWMSNNLLLLFKVASGRGETETEMIKVLNPPLNLQKNKNMVNKAYRNRLSELRNDLSDLKV